MKKIILDPYPRKKEEIFSKSSLNFLKTKYEIIEFGSGSDRFNFYKKYINDVSYIIGQPKLDIELLKKSIKESKHYKTEWEKTMKDKDTY